MPPPLPAAYSPLPAAVRVAHLVRPAEGGMRAQVKSLLAAFPPSLLAAPPDVCDFCADVVAKTDLLRLPAAHRPDQLLINGLRAGKWAKQNGAQILHGHGLQWTPLFASAQAASGLPLIVTLHNLVPPDLSRVQKIVLQAAMSRAVRVLCVSEAVAESAKATTGAGAKCVVVRNGIDVMRFAESASPFRADVRASLHLPPDALAVFCVARLSPEKGMPMLLQAVSLLKTERHMKVFIVGDGPQKHELQKMANDYGLNDRVQFLGIRSDVPALLRAADVYVQPSHSEGLGMAVLEAMASGLPVVASRVGGLPEVVTDNETGLLTEPQNPAAFAFALLILLSITKKRTAMGQAGRTRAVSHFGTARMISETQAVYSVALAQQSKRRMP